MATTLTNSLEGVTPSGTTLTAGAGGNTGTAPDSFFDTVNIGTGATNASDSAQAAHGSLSLKIATGATAATSYVAWAASFPTVTIAWYRLYMFLAAYPTAGNPRFIGAQNSTAAIIGSVRLNNNTGTISVQNSANTVITGMTTTNAVPLNAWCRIEGYFNATAGVAEINLFLAPDSATATETLTSAGGQSLGANVAQFRFGQSGGATANYGPHWYDDLGISDTAYLGPAVPAGGLLPQQISIRRPAVPAGRAAHAAVYGR